MIDLSITHAAIYACQRPRLGRRLSYSEDISLCHVVCAIRYNVIRKASFFYSVDETTRNGKGPVDAISEAREVGGRGTREYEKSKKSGNIFIRILSTFTESYAVFG